MKKIFILMSVCALTIMSCGNKVNTPSTETQSTDTVIEVIDSVVNVVTDTID